ncbi:hypothetical protein BGZ76_010900 [Entomortierella beljakovae]|nr:hypothetical protein BGZ76_010900 [Entomortierella beljakovae]
MIIPKPIDEKQGFREVYRDISLKTVATSPEITYIMSKYYIKTKEYVVLWSDIQKTFDGAVQVLNKDTVVPIEKDGNLRTIKPRHIHVVPGVVLDVVVKRRESDNTPKKQAAPELEKPASKEPSLVEIDMMLNEQDLLDDFFGEVEQENEQEDEDEEAEDEEAEDEDVKEKEEEAVASELSSLSDWDSDESDEDAIDDIPTHETVGGNYIEATGPNIQEGLCSSWDFDDVDEMDSASLYIRALMLEEGDIVFRDIDMAIQYYIMAATQGSYESMHRLGQLYEKGEDLPQSYSEAVEWYLKASEDPNNSISSVNAFESLENMDRHGNIPSEYSEFLRYFLKVFRENDDVSMCNIGHMYEHGVNFISKNESKAVEWYRKSANQGSSLAQFTLGTMYESGTKVIPRDYKTAIDWYKKAASQDHIIAQCNLGNIHRFGKGTSVDSKEAVNWYLKAANQGDSRAVESLKSMAGLGEVPQNNLELVETIVHAVIDKETHAQFALGCRYENGDGVPKSLTGAIDWYSKAANGGYAEAQYTLGYKYEVGDGVKLDYSLAMELYRRAALKDHPAAQHSLGQMYEDGTGTMPDKARAMEWHLKSAKQNHAPAQCSLGGLYLRGDGVSPNYSEAVYWYLLAAYQGDVPAVDNLVEMKKSSRIPSEHNRVVEILIGAIKEDKESSQYALGNRIKYMSNIHDNVKTAVSWYRKAAERGYPKAQLAMGDAYEQGCGVEQSYSKASQWYLRAANQQQEDAQFKLSELYRYGNGILKDKSMSLEWLYKAGRNGSTDAQFKLGQMYEDGDRVCRDVTIAIDWYIMAAYKGQTNSITRLQDMYDNGHISKADCERLGPYIEL